METTPTASVFFVLGGPGAGKGTVCKRLMATGRYCHLSAGDLLREERKSGSSVAELIETCIVEGTIVPAYVTVSLLRKAMQAHGWSQQDFLIDGFPRNFENYDAWRRDMEDVRVKGLVFLDCPDQVLIDRIMVRAEARSDDNLESLRKRLAVFHEQTALIIQHFEEKGLMLRVHSDSPPDTVFAELSTSLQTLV